MMKKIMLSITLMILSCSLFGQETVDGNLIVNGSVKLGGTGAKIYWDWPDRTIEQYSSDGGLSRMIRFRNSMGGSNPDGGFDFADYNGESVLRIIRHNVGIGTTNPSNKLHVEGSSGIRVSGNGSNQIFLEGVRNGSGTNIRLYDNNNNIYYDSRTNMTFRANQLGGSGGSINLTGGNIGIGTTNPGIWKLAVNGKVRAKEIKVETGWSDFVFYDNYQLPTLTDVEIHIKEKGHLKDIPSAKEVAENGIFLGEMNAKLLQKIEELTLYIIEQEKKIKDEVQKNIEQAKYLKDLSVRLENIEKKLRRN